MRKRIDKLSIESYIARELDSKPYNQAIILIVLLAFNLVVFGYFGVFKGYKAFSAKRSLLAEYRNAEENLRKNIEVIDNFEPYVSDNRGLEFLNVALPKSATNSDFLQELARIYSRNGFVFDRVLFSTVDDLGAQKVSTNIVGRVADLPDLIQDLEAMTRIISITSISGSPTKSTDSAEFRLSIEFEIYQVIL